MDTGQKHDEPERREGLGGRVRRFIDSELSRALDKQDRSSDETHPERRHPPAPVAESAERQESADRNVQATADERGTGLEEAAPVEAARTHDSPADSARVEEPESVPAHGRSSSEIAADGSAARVGLLNDPAGLREEWQQLQGTFVDDPQRAVHEASVLVDRTLREIHENVTRGQISDPTSTEDLRVSFQRYREFFQRLLSA